MQNYDGQIELNWQEYFYRAKDDSGRAFSIYTDIRKLRDKAKTSYTLSTRRLRFGYE